MPNVSVFNCLIVSPRTWSWTFCFDFTKHDYITLGSPLLQYESGTLYVKPAVTQWIQIGYKMYKTLLHWYPERIERTITNNVVYTAIVVSYALLKYYLQLTSAWISQSTNTKYRFWGKKHITFCTKKKGSFSFMSKTCKVPERSCKYDTLPQAHHVNESIMFKVCSPL